jgi:hypothetical protein
VAERVERGLVGEDLPDRGQLGPAALGVHVRADRSLHPGVGGEDEVGGQAGPDRDGPDRGEVDALGQPVPAEDPQPEERRLEEERGQPLDRQRRAEHVADEARVLAPRHPELELLHDPGGDAEREVDQQQLAPEAGHAQVALIPRPVPLRLHQRDEERQPDRDRDEEEVVDRRDRELPARDVQRVHRLSASAATGFAAIPSAASSSVTSTIDALASPKSIAVFGS